jgi:hypothetical protein
VVIDAPIDTVAPCLPRAMGLVEPLDADATRLIGSTSNPVWYAAQLTTIPASYRIVTCPELRQAARAIGQRLLAAGAADPSPTQLVGQADSQRPTTLPSGSSK